jgi:hypothetical protein
MKVVFATIEWRQLRRSVRVRIWSELYMVNLQQPCTLAGAADLRADAAATDRLCDRFVFDCVLIVMVGW